ncbi:MAG: galactitol-1-phosphate 5-dehydrogenase, partial [Oscillospiraceae bacterium]|nr:galactitol-1-phosphate 5-dehydrogenase [Oscillospiraceae bacterium]
MKAAVLYANEDIRFDDCAEPVIDSESVIIKVKAAGICGSDIPRVLYGKAHGYPAVLGHEFSGEIVEIGKNVKTLNVGERAAGAPLIPCMRCEVCVSGWYALCKHYDFIGSRRQGAFAEYVKLPAANAVRFDDNITYEQGAFFEPSTVALHGLRCVGYRGGENVAILGGGTIGLFTMQWAKILGAKQTVVFDISNDRLALAKILGADAVVNTTKDGYIAQAIECVNNRGYGFVFETAGQNATMNIAFEIAANKAGVCFIGTSSSDLLFDWKLFEKMNRKEFHLTGSWMSY